MDPEQEDDSANLEALIGLWQNEEMRLRAILQDPDTSPMVKEKASERLAFVLEQIRAFSEELDVSS